MAKSILITRPNHDQTTNYLYYWSGFVINEAKKKRMDIYDLAGKKANKKDFDSYVSLQKPNIIFINGHGDENRLAGHDDEILLRTGGNKILNGNIVYARSCDAATNVGKELIGKGAKAFIGYIRKFNLVYTPSKISRPLEDPLAKLFLEPSNLVVTTIIKGHDAGTAHLRARNSMVSNFRKMMSTAATIEENYAAVWLWGNIKSQVVYGDSRAKI